MPESHGAGPNQRSGANNGASGSSMIAGVVGSATGSASTPGIGNSAPGAMVGVGFAGPTVGCHASEGGSAFCAAEAGGGRTNVGSGIDCAADHEPGIKKPSANKQL